MSCQCTQDVGQERGTTCRGGHSGRVDGIALNQLLTSNGSRNREFERSCTYITSQKYEGVDVGILVVADVMKGGEYGVCICVYDGP